jgi:hypothetical protein
MKDMLITLWNMSGHAYTFVFHKPSNLKDMLLTTAYVWVERSVTYKSIFLSVSYNLKLDWPYVYDLQFEIVVYDL